MDEEGLVFRRRKAWLENICNDNKIDLKKKINGMSVFDENLGMSLSISLYFDLIKILLFSINWYLMPFKLFQF